MKIRYLSEADVAATLDVPTTMGLLDRAARAHAAGDAMSMPRQRPRTGTTTMQVLPAAYAGRLGHKTYLTGVPKGAGVRFNVTLYDGATGAMLAIIESDMLGQIRTGAAAGLATQVLARPDARVGAVIGTGRQAWSQVVAMCTARPLEVVHVIGRNVERAEAFCTKLRGLVATRIERAPDAAAAVAAADIVTTITNAGEPVLFGAWLKPGTHVNAAGSNHPTRPEIDAETVRRAGIIAVEDVAQAKGESADLLFAERAGAFTWERAVRLADVVAGSVPGRTSPSEITLFESLGIGLWDIAAANEVYDRCVAAGRGREVELVP